MGKETLEFWKNVEFARLIFLILKNRFRLQTLRFQTVLSLSRSSQAPRATPAFKCPAAAVQTEEEPAMKKLAAATGTAQGSDDSMEPLPANKAELEKILNDPQVKPLWTRSLPSSELL